MVDLLVLLSGCSYPPIPLDEARLASLDPVVQARTIDDLDPAQAGAYRGVLEKWAEIGRPRNDQPLPNNGDNVRRTAMHAVARISDYRAFRFVVAQLQEGHRHEAVYAVQGLLPGWQDELDRQVGLDPDVARALWVSRQQ